MHGSIFNIFRESMTFKFELFVENPEKTSQFYQEMFNFEEIQSSERYTEIKKGDVRIGLGFAKNS